MSIHKPAPRGRDIRRAQGIQDQILSGLSPGQKKKLKDIGFNPILGRTGDFNFSQSFPTPRTLVTNQTLRSNRPGATLRHEIGHQLLGSPSDNIRLTGGEHVTMSQFGSTAGSKKEPFADPVLSSRAFGGLASKSGVQRARVQARRQRRRLKGKVDSS